MQFEQAADGDHLAEAGEVARQLRDHPPFAAFAEVRRAAGGRFAEGGQLHSRWDFRARQIERAGLHLIRQPAIGAQQLQ